MDGGAFKYWEPLIISGRCAGHQSRGVSNYVVHHLFFLGFTPHSLSLSPFHYCIIIAIIIIISSTIIIGFISIL